MFPLRHDSDNGVSSSVDHEDLAAFSSSIERWMSSQEIEERVALEVCAMQEKACLAKIDFEVLAQLNLYFRESYADSQKLQHISVPLLPEQNDTGPVVLVRLADGGRIVVNGNNRIYKALESQHSPVYALEFDSAEAFTFAFGIQIKQHYDDATGTYTWGKSYLTVR
jgi:hypothetical protein